MREHQSLRMENLNKKTIIAINKLKFYNESLHSE